MLTDGIDISRGEGKENVQAGGGMRGGGGNATTEMHGPKEALAHLNDALQE